MMSKAKLILFAILFLVLVIIAFQNLTEIEVHLLFRTVKMPQAVLLTATLVVGFAMGISANALWKMRSWRKARANRDLSGTEEL